MAAGGSGTSFVKTKRVEGFSLLTSAACEWFLIFLLLAEAALSYLLAKFARYCRLQLPCLLCSRLDHILGGDKQEFYQNLFCSHHQSEISSLVQCHIHGKLADGNRMCDDCLLSFTTSTKPNRKSHRLLMGKFGVVIGGSGSQSPTRDLFTGSKGSRPCDCCGKLWKSEQNAPRSIQLKSPGRAVLKPYIPLPHAPRQSRLNHRDNMKKIRDQLLESAVKSSFQPYHSGYSELKLNSDSESDFPFSDDDDVASVFHGNIEASKGHVAQFKSVAPSRHLLKDLNLEVPNSSLPKAIPLHSELSAEPKISKHHDEKFLDSDADKENHPEEINLQLENQSSSDLPELISLDEVPPSPIAMNIPSEEPKDNKTASDLSQNSLPAVLSELMSLDVTHAPLAASSDKSVDVTQSSGAELVSEEYTKVIEEIVTTENASAETDHIVSDSAPASPRQENTSNMSKSPVSTKGSEVPGFVIEQPTSEEVNVEEVNTIVEEMELSPSHNTSLHGSNMTSVVSINHVESTERHDEASNSDETKELSKSSSVQSDLEYLDGSNITEIEGESIVDQLKRQMDALLKELEEERNASATATNEAMSMITRLQEEKAALQMEAHQYLRMMEEQAEYDNDELDKVNDLLTEKEKEIQDLEAELEFYRSNWTGKPMVQSMHEDSYDSKPENVTIQNIGVHTNEPVIQSSDLKGENVAEQKAGVDNIANTVNISDSKLTEVSKFSYEDAAGIITPLEFKEEKLYILQRLKGLEKKLVELSGNGISSEMPTVRPEKLEVGKLDQQGTSNGEEPQLDGQEETDSLQKNIMSNGNHTEKDGLAASDSDDYSLGNENSHSTSVRYKSFSPAREFDLVALENEIADLNDRLEALEFDHDLLEHIINSLRNEDDVKQFIQDIAHQLHELRKVGIRSR